MQAILVKGVPTGAIEAGTEAQVLLDRTSFYAEKGGQVGDHGRITTPAGAVFEVTDTQFVGEAVAHHGRRACASRRCDLCARYSAQLSFPITSAP